MRGSFITSPLQSRRETIAYKRKPSLGPGKGKKGVKNPRKASKFKNQEQYVGDKYFHSKSEAERYKQLVVLEEHGFISQLECQPSYTISINNHVICRVLLDFRYIEHGMADIERVEDVKGFRTDMYRLKKKLVEAAHQIEVIEVPAPSVAKWAGALPHKDKPQQKKWLPRVVFTPPTED